jgi:drug/metabolite transporter (DMT)-like permease
VGPRAAPVGALALSRAAVVALTTLAMAAFASNSLLTRAALAPGRIDAASFTLVRLASGAAVLLAITRGRRAGAGLAGPLALFAYAAPFSFAYLRIGAAVGALVLFGVVQVSMIGWGLRMGERPGARVSAGLALASSGLLVLLLPAATRPDALGLALMALAGAAWGAYSLLGRGLRDPIAANARSFALAVPLALAPLAAGLAAGSLRASPAGLALAAASGGLTSGLGYAVWYPALSGLAASQAAVVQLSVPVLAAVGAVLLLGERVGPGLLVSGVLVLGGVGLALGARVGARVRPGTR